MDQRDITLALCRKLPKVDPITVSLVVDEVFPAIMTFLAHGKDVDIPGFGKFVTHKLKAHRRKLPTTEEEIEVPERMQAKFIPSRNGFRKTLKHAAIPPRR